MCTKNHASQEGQPPKAANFFSFQEICHSDVSPEAMELLIDFCYTTTITIEEDNVQQLLPAACLLQMSQVQQYCCEFLSKQLHPSNCLGKLKF